MTDDQGWLARHRRRLMDGYAERSRTKAAGKALDSRAPGPTTLVIWVLAALVHLVSVAVLAFGAWCVWTGPLMVRIPGVLLVLFGLLLVPKPTSARKLGGLGRADLPELFALLDRVADHNGGPVPHVVMIDIAYNASAGTVGRRRVLTLGAPYWSAMSGPARLALLGHELGHFAHRDLLSLAWTSSAHDALWQWRMFLYDLGRTIDPWYEEETGLRVVNVLLRALALPPRIAVDGYFLLMELVNASSSRSREYLADLDAISTGGSAGALALRDTALAGNAVEAAIRRAAIRHDDVWAEVHETLARDDLTTRHRRRAHAAQEQSRIDDSHPSDVQRIRLIEEREQVGPGVVVDTATWHRLDAELAPYLDQAGAALAQAVRYQH